MRFMVVSHLLPFETGETGSDFEDVTEVVVRGVVVKVVLLDVGELPGAVVTVVGVSLVVSFLTTPR